jgi:hypothetical protein
MYGIEMTYHHVLLGKLLPLGEYIGAKEFTPSIADAFSQLLILYESQEDEQPTVKPEFKAGSQWRPFKEGAIVYFNSIHGCHNIPLAYII